MKTKQTKEELEKSADEDVALEPKTRARKKADEDDKNKSSQEDPKTSKEPRKNVAKPKAIIKKRPLGIRKTLRSKKAVIPNKDKVKKIIKPAGKRGRKPLIKTEPETSQDKETEPLIPVSDIKKEPVEETSPSSRSSSPRTAGRRQRLSSDIVMMKSVLADPPSSLVLGPRTSPYSMRSERSNSPSMFEGKTIRTLKPRKAKANLLNEVVIKEQKKRRRLLSDAKTPDESLEDCKKLKRGRSCSRDGSEISKCSDNTESDLSLSESLNDADGKELNKKLDKAKTDLDIDIENNVQISTTVEKVPSLNDEPKLADTKPDKEINCVTNEKTKKSLSLKRSTSLDSDNNNSNRLKLDNLNTSDIEDKSIIKTENDTLFEARSSILNSMSKTFNSKEVSKNIRKARRGRKVAAATRTNSTPGIKNGVTTTIPSDSTEEKQETLESLSKEIDDLINNLDQNIDGDLTNDTVAESTTEELKTKPISKVHVAKALSESNTIISPETPVKEKEALSITTDSTPSKIDDSENIRLHYEEDSMEKPSDSPKTEIIYKSSTVASIDKLMDRLKEFEEFDKRRQRQESESNRSTDGKSVMVTNDVVLIPKSGADIKPLKDIQTVRSPERPMEKENVMSCFENNSAISLLKRDQARKSIDVDLPNSVTLIKRNSISSRKESTSSNHSKETDAISIFEKSLGKDVTLTEIRKSVGEKTSTQVDLHQFATLHPNNPNQSLAVLDTNQISILPRVTSDVQITKRNSRSSRESISRKSSESGNDDGMATIEKIKPQSQVISSEISITPTPVAIKSPEATQPMETEALGPPLDTVKNVPEDITLIAKAKPEVDTAEVIKIEGPKSVSLPADKPENKESVAEITTTKTTESEQKPTDVEMAEIKEKSNEKPATEQKPKEEEKKGAKTVKGNKSARNSIESLPGPSSALHETPESQKRKENVLRTLGLLTHKAAKEAKIEKLKEKERIYGSHYGGIKSKVKPSGDYTGTLKTVIKLNRGESRDKKKYRSSLKMTFQKSKVRSGKPQVEEGQETNEDEAYYTIERREGAAGATSDGGHRKSYSNRLNNHDGEAPPEPEPKETLNLVIPEKASSFSIHPGRLCMDQCFYCGGKFGLFDTPCHIAQMKSAERQKKVLDNEEKLTIDSCLCDACYRHVDRRANCPSYRKRPAKLPTPPPEQTPDESSEKPPVSPPEDDDSSEEGEPAASARPAVCHTTGCARPADHSIRRKWLIKMRASVNKLLKLEGDYPGLHTIPLCSEHYRALAPLLSCGLCRRKITKHHNVHLLHSWSEVNPLLVTAGVPVEWSERPVVCKLCRYYCSLLQRPQHHQQHLQHYRAKLLQIYNIVLPPETEVEQQETNQEDQNSSKKKKARTKSKQRKSTDPEKPDSEASSEKTESSPEKDKPKEDQNQEEDIESLISSNKIPVPGAKVTEVNENEEGVYDFDMPVLPVDKQTELQYLLQKQNNPAQFLKLTNMTKQKNAKLNSIQKPGQQQRILDKNAKRIQKIGQVLTQKEKKDDDMETEKAETNVFKNISLNDECTIETIPNKKPADINTLKNKWQMTDSFTQVKKNLSELSKKLTVEKEPKKTGAKYLNPVKRLETNPSISVRELFPGEEEMNLQCSIEFNNVKSVTPEGWEKCNTTIQYDLETKKLWNELQRPYGNQSSFLRHLILLEKYFRNGDLVLSQNATPHAANYSDSVQSRLRAYDNVVNDTPRRAEPAISLIEYRKKPSINGKSLLKANQEEKQKNMPPPGSIPKPKQKGDKPKKQLPPELIAINTPNAQGRKAIQNVLHNIQQLVKGVSASDPTEVAAAPLPTPAPKFEGPKEKKDPPKEKKDPPKEKKDPPKEAKDTPTKKQKPTSKPWRPTLMPITPENVARIAREPTQVAVDGRHLPSLVQVMSSGKRYHITLQDYNKMCIMRREKLQQLQDGDKKKEEKETTVVTEIQPSAMLGNGGTVVQNIPQEPEKKEMPELTQISTNAANILKNVGLKNITIAPIPAKTATVTSNTSPSVSSPSLLVTSTPIKLPQLGPEVSITSETVLTPSTIMSSSMIMPKIPKSLTVIPQTVVGNVSQMASLVPQGMVVPQGVVMPHGMVVPQSVTVPQGIVVPQMVIPATSSTETRP